jgi:hypothetical protein
VEPHECGFAGHSPGFAFDVAFTLQEPSRVRENEFEGSGVRRVAVVGDGDGDASAVPPTSLRLDVHAAVLGGRKFFEDGFEFSPSFAGDWFASVEVRGGVSGFPFADL